MATERDPLDNLVGDIATVRNSARFLRELQPHIEPNVYEQERKLLLGTIAAAAQVSPEDAERILYETEEAIEDEEQPRG